MFQRGHLDHVALGAASSEQFETLRDRLVARGATDGAVEDLGAFHSIWFTDPDGMHAELTLIVDATLQGIHARARSTARPRLRSADTGPRRSDEKTRFGTPAL